MAGFGVTSSARTSVPTAKAGVVNPGMIGGGSGVGGGAAGVSGADIARLLNPQPQSGSIPGSPGVYAGGPNLNAGKPAASGSAPAPSAVPATPTVASGSPVVNKAEANPTATAAIDMLMARAKGDMGLGKEIDRGVQDIRSNALAGIAGDRLSRVARGVSGTGIDTYDANKQSDQQKAEVNRMVNDRTIAAEAMRNDLLGSTANLALNTSGQQLQAQGMNTAAANAQSELDLRRQAEARQERNDVWNMNEAASARARDDQLRSFQQLLNFLT